MDDLPQIPETLARCPTGSRFICSPPVMDTDIDFALLVADLHTYGEALRADGWDVTLDDPEYMISYNNEIEFITARKGQYNLIVFANHVGYFAFKDATHVAKQLNLTNKEHRVMLFRAVCSNRHIRDISLDT